MYTDDYMTYLKKEKRMSENTRAAYGRDLADDGSSGSDQHGDNCFSSSSEEPWEIVGYGKPETGVTAVFFSLSDPCGDDGIRSDGEHQVAKDRAENH